MSGLPTVLHPTFEALSAYADDEGDVVAATRIGRHVARCANCRAQVAEVRALGDGARAMVFVGAPAGLWSRIEAAASTGRGGAARVQLPSTEPRLADVRSPMTRRHRAVLAAACLLGAAVAGVALLPRPASLQAAGTSRLTFAPSRPVPGGTVRVRYDAPAWMKDASTLVLVGRYARPAGSNMVPFGARIGGELADSLGTLTRAADGAFVGTLTLPADFLAVALGVHDPVREEADADGIAPWFVIGGTARRAPSFASFLAAHDIAPEYYGSDPAWHPRQGVDAADSLKRYFPRHPAGWAFSRSYGVSRGRFDFLRFFESAERKYSSMFDALWPQPRLDAERLHDMVVFGHRIDEPAEAMRWAVRLADEHPDDPRALTDLASALHSLELASGPSVGDSIRRWLPALDRVYRAGPVPNVGFDGARHLAAAYGDSGTKALWAGRAGPNGATDNIWLMVSREPGKNDSATAEIRLRAGSPCTLPPGRYPLVAWLAEWRSRCELFRGVAYGYLSVHTLEGGQPKQALAEADSAIVSMRRARFCTPSRGYHSHALAALALGDTATAARDFMAGSAGYPASENRMLDTARVHLGRRFDEAAMLAGADSARRAATVCEAERLARRQVFRRRLTGETDRGH